MAASTCMILPVIFGCMFGRSRIGPAVTAQIMAKLPLCQGMRLCSPHSLQHLLDLALGLRELLCIAGA